MKTKSFSLICALVLAFSGTVFAQDDDSDEWIGGGSETRSKPAASSSYDGGDDSEFADDEVYAKAYARYKNEATTKAEINRQRTEGFARSIMLGVRAQGGTNTFFGTNSEGWTLGWQAGGGLMVKMPLGFKYTYIVPELTFNFRQYRYEENTDYGTNEASIDIMMFEIPIIVRYNFEDYNLYAGLGLNIGLKLTGSSEFDMNLDVGNDKHYENTIATSGVEVGGALDFGYMFSRYVHFNIRVVQCFTSLLNQTLVAQKEFMDSSLLTFYTTAGINIFF
ncbi:MAG: outer membrane beta-barrel protein [Fibrobacter sp.]|nr:outer membrane beta-barrel protein [Fibrobacter sp.]